MFNIFKGRGFKKFSMCFDGEAQYDRVMNFMKDLEKDHALRLVDIHRCQVVDKNTGIQNNDIGPIWVAQGYTTKKNYEKLYQAFGKTLTMVSEWRV